MTTTITTTTTTTSTTPPPLSYLAEPKRHGLLIGPQTITCLKSFIGEDTGGFAFPPNIRVQNTVRITLEDLGDLLDRENRFSEGVIDRENRDVG